MAKLYVYYNEDSISSPLVAETIEELANNFAAQQEDMDNYTASLDDISIMEIEYQPNKQAVYKPSSWSAAPLKPSPKPSKKPKKK